MKKIIILLFVFLILLFVFNCQNPNADKVEGNGWLKLVSPDHAPLNKAVYGLTPSEVEDLQGSIRYDIVLESNGNIINKKTLKNNQAVEILVPAGKKFNVGVGLYLAKSKSNDDTLINSYIVSDVVRNVIAQSGDTVYIVLTLNYNDPTNVEYYYKTSNDQYLGIADINGSVIYNGSGNLTVSPMFTSFSNINNNPKLSYYETSINHFFMNEGILDDGTPFYGKIFKVDYESNPRLWCINSTLDRITVTPNNLIIPSDIITNFAGTFPPGLNYDDTTSDASKYIDYVDRINNIYVSYDVIVPPSSVRLTYFFLLHNNGFIIARFSGETTGSFIDQASNVNFNQYSSIHPELPFILDIKRDYDTNGVQNFFITKIGAYYVDHLTFMNFANAYYNNDITPAMSRLKRQIKIPNPSDPYNYQLITNVAVLGNKIYLSTSSGLYYINKSDSAWASFRSASPTEARIFPEDKINKIKTFKDCKVISMFTDESNILMIATNKSLWFYNTDNGNFKEITIWDGLPFIPDDSQSYEPSFSSSDYSRGGISPIRNVLWDSANQKYWIATMHGLGSINKSDVF